MDTLIATSADLAGDQTVICRAEAVRYPDPFVAKIRTMAEKDDDEEIVLRLNGEGLTSSTGKPFTVSIVRWIRFKHRVATHRSAYGQPGS